MSAKVTQYVAGFLFAEALGGQRVLLIEKRRPRWQAGRWNGIGGHIEPGESALEAMVREFNEEAGLLLADWQHFATLSGRTFCVHFFCNFVEGEIFDLARAKTDEPIYRVHVDDVFKKPILPNLRVLIPLALDKSGIAKPVLLYDEMAQAA